MEIKKRTPKKTRTTDGFQNFVARLGTGTDSILSKGTYSLDSMFITRNRTLLEGAYRGSWIVRRMIDVIAEDMVREGIDIITEADNEKILKVQKHLSMLSIWDSLAELHRWGDLFGGAAAIMLIDGEDLSQPLDVSTMRPNSFRGLRVLSRWEIFPLMDKIISDFSPLMGMPEYYYIAAAQDERFTGQTIHYSRVLRAVGAPLPYYQKIAELYWGESTVEIAFDRLQAFDSATIGGANLLMKSYLRVLGIDGLRDILTEGGDGEKALIKHFTYIRQLQQNEGITLIDSADNFQTYNWSFSGMADAITSFGEQISGATGIPLVRLFGQSPKGLNATGQSDLITYYDTIATKQTDDMRPQLMQLFPVLWFSMFSEPLPEDFDFSFRPLYKISEDEKSIIFQRDVSAYAQLFDMGLSADVILEELRKLSHLTGRGQTITPELIEEMRLQPPRLPDIDTPEETQNGPTTPVNELPAF